MDEIKRLFGREVAKCECCGFKEVCTPAYIAGVRKDFHGRWVCGLCAEAVKEELCRSERQRSIIVEGCRSHRRSITMEEEAELCKKSITIEEALTAHTQFCKQINIMLSVLLSAALLAACSKWLGRLVTSCSTT
ncbi:hypothetical protein SUGI_1091500 [Cryptomeria japonica]|nr:hypothetical protein SUGI_1091500 [Cryptomeria japonica]